MPKPGLDVSFLTSDPLLADSFSVTRRLDVLGLDGRTTPTVERVFDCVIGVVTQQDPAQLMRDGEAQSIGRNIFIAATFQFYGPEQKLNGSGYQPDLVVWQGSTYVVKQVYPYHRYGAGVYEIVAEAITATDVPQ